MKIPFWLFKMLFGKQMADVDRRSPMTGKASTSKRKDLGPVEVETTITVDRPPPTPWPGSNPNKVNWAEAEFEERRRRGL